MGFRDLTRTIGMLRSEGIDGYFAHKYDQFADLPISRERYQETAERVVQEITKGLILEIGPGPGYTAIEMAKLLDAVKIVGLDASKTMLEIARRHVKEAGLSDRITFRWGNAAELPFPDNHFDFAVSSGSLHEWKQAPQVFEEIHRVLKDGGSALIGDLRRDAPREALDEIAQAIPSAIMRWGLRHSVAEAYTKEELATLLHQTSWSDFRIHTDDLGLTITLRKQSTATSTRSLG